MQGWNRGWRSRIHGENEYQDRGHRPSDGIDACEGECVPQQQGTEERVVTGPQCVRIIASSLHAGRPGRE